MKLDLGSKVENIDFSKFRKYATEQAKLFKNVGMAIAVVSHDKVLFEEGMGYKDNPRKLPFTNKTLFPIGSHTKSITATAMAMLIDEGLAEWEKPIREYIPEFRLKDPFASERATIQDVLSHITGLPHHQFAFLNSEWNYKKIFKQLPYLEPLYDFRTKHKYSNLNYFIVTKIIEELSGESYFSFVNKKIFSPLGMTRTNFSITETIKSEDYAKGYKESENNFIEEEYLELKDISAGAGCVNSCLEDMCKWIQFHLNKGKVKGKQLLSEKTLGYLYTLQKLDKNILSIISPEKNYATTYGYAFGWWTLDYRGAKLVQHYGTGPGLAFNGGFMPDYNLGYVLFSNTTGSDLPFFLNFNLADQLLGLEPVDWFTKIQEFTEKQNANIPQEKQLVKEQKKDTKPSHSLSDYIGKYIHPGYGTLEFYLENDELKAKYGEHSRKISIEHHIYDTFKFTILGSFGFSRFCTFRTNFQGEVDSLEIDAEPSLKPAIFKKHPK